MSLLMSDKQFKAAAMYAKGERLVDICRALDCSDKLVYRAISLAGVPIRAKVDAAARREEIIRMYQSGMTIAAIARALDVHYSTAAHDLTGVKKRPLNPKYLRQKSGLLLGLVSDIPPDAMLLVSQKIKRGETILACMARLIVQDGCRDKKE